MYNKYYQEELAFLRDLGREFSQAHPDAAHFLAEQGSDPDVERLLEGFAFLTGRLRQKLDDELPEMTHSLLGLLWPHYLRPIPSITMIQFSPVRGTLRERLPIRRGVELDSVPVEGTSCRFRTASPLILEPVVVEGAAFELAPGGGSLLRILLQASPGLTLPQLRLERLRFHLTGETSTVSVLYNLLDRYVAEASICSTVGGRPLASLPLAPGSVRTGGFAEEDALLPYPANSFPGYRLLQEYFAFPPKFHFVEVGGLERASELGGEDRLEISVRFSRQPASVLRLGAENFLLGCVPAVNLFAREADPIRAEHDRTEYLVRAQGKDPAHYEIYSVDEVRGFSPGTAEVRVYPSFFSFLHAGMPAGREELYHHVRLKPAVVGGGTETYLSFHAGVGPATLPRAETISVRLTCTNRNLTRGLRVGDISVATATSPETARFRNITGVTPSAPPPLEGDLPWRLVSHLALNPLSLAGTEALRSLLGLYNFQAIHNRQAARENELRLEAVRSVRGVADQTLYRGAPVRGLHTTVELADEKFAGEGDLVLFCNVLNEVLALYASLNSFSRLTVKALHSGEVYSWPPRMGRQIIL